MLSLETVLLSLRHLNTLPPASGASHRGGRGRALLEEVCPWNIIYKSMQLTLLPVSFFCFMLAVKSVSAGPGRGLLLGLAVFMAGSFLHCHAARNRGGVLLRQRQQKTSDQFSSPLLPPLVFGKMERLKTCAPPGRQRPACVWLQASVAGQEALFSHISPGALKEENA